MATQTHQSTFVNGLAWTSIVVSGFMAFISFIQNLMAFFLFSGGGMGQVMQAQPAMQKMPAVIHFIFLHFELILLMILLFSLAQLFISIGLLRRRDWARRVFIAVLALGIVWSLCGLGLQQSIMPQFNDLSATMDQATIQFQTMAHVMRYISIGMVIGFILLYGWLIKRLMSPAIRAEFRKFTTGEELNDAS